MKRRQLLRYAQLGLFSTITTSLVSRLEASQAQTENRLTVQSLGHTCFLFTGGGLRVLVNPFRPIGCTTGYRPPKINTDLVLISSRLFDEGVVEGLPGNPTLLYEPGVYKFEGRQIQGIRTKKDREGGRRFGLNTAWLWQQSGIRIVHLGALAGKLDIEEQILFGRPDLLLLPVGGGPKAYKPEEAKQVVDLLKPKLIIPTHYRTVAADPTACDLVNVDDFLTLMGGTQTKRLESDKISFKPGDLPKDNTTIIRVLSYQFNQPKSNQATPTKP